MVLLLVLATFIAPEVEEDPRPQIALAQPRTGFQLAQKSSGKPPRDDFDLLPKQAPPTAAALARQRELERQLEKRRTMLKYHQIGGYPLLGNLTATVVLGQLDYNDKYGAGSRNANYPSTRRSMYARSGPGSARTHPRAAV